MELLEFYSWLKNNYTTFTREDCIEIIENNNKIIVDLRTDKFTIKGGIAHDHSRIFDLKKQENWSVLVLLLKLLKKGYSKEVIHLEIS